MIQLWRASFFAILPPLREKSSRKICREYSASAKHCSNDFLLSKVTPLSDSDDKSFIAILHRGKFSVRLFSNCDCSDQKYWLRLLISAGVRGWESLFSIMP